MLFLQSRMMHTRLHMVPCSDRVVHDIINRSIYRFYDQWNTSKSNYRGDPFLTNWSQGCEFFEDKQRSCTKSVDCKSWNNNRCQTLP